MDRFDASRLRILDDFNVTASMNVKSIAPESSTTDIEVDVEPLVLRLSLRDIFTCYANFYKGSLSCLATMRSLLRMKNPKESKRLKPHPQVLSANVDRPPQLHVVTNQEFLSQRNVNKEKATSTRQTTLRREDLKAHIDGFRLVLIGDQHELPFLDWSVESFGSERA